MARTIRKDLILKTEQALNNIDRLDQYLYDMGIEADGRQPAIDSIAPTLLDAHEMVRQLWQALRKQL